MPGQEDNDPTKRILDAIKTHEAREEPVLDSMRESIERIGVAQESHVRRNEVQHGSIQSTLDGIKEELYGGKGVIGLEGRMTLVEKALEDLSEIKKLIRKGVFTIVMATVTGFVGLGWWAIKQLVEN